jgi:rfaE bifunctional protein nucleotidyltransferase chain/domain
MNFKKKILELDKLKLEIEKVKESGRKVIHCHGVFDLLHPGHLRHFQEARSLGDILVVTTTSDNNIFKGDGRPVFSQDLRCEYLASVEYIDFVGINDDIDAIELIKTLKPSLYVKGSEYKVHGDDKTGKIELEVAAVESVGGKAHYTEDIIFSSTEILNKYFLK